MLKEIWSIGFARITNKKQAEKIVQLYACLVAFAIALVVISWLTVYPSTDLYTLTYAIIVGVVIGAVLVKEMYKNKNRGVTVFILIGTVVGGLEYISRLFYGSNKTDNFLNLMGMGALIYITARAVYASFKFHQFKNRELYA